MKFDSSSAITYVSKNKLFEIKFYDFGGQGWRYDEKSSFNRYVVLCKLYKIFFTETKRQKEM